MCPTWQVDEMVERDSIHRLAVVGVVLVSPGRVDVGSKLFAAAEVEVLGPGKK
jgi:hypothetical protein